MQQSIAGRTLTYVYTASGVFDQDHTNSGTTTSFFPTKQLRMTPTRLADSRRTWNHLTTRHIQQKQMHYSEQYQACFHCTPGHDDKESQQTQSIGMTGVCCYAHDARSPAPLHALPKPIQAAKPASTVRCTCPAGYCLCLSSELRDSIRCGNQLHAGTKMHAMWASVTCTRLDA